jgi:hypothetical protein
MVLSATCTGKHATPSSGSLSVCPVQTSYRQPWAGQRTIVPRSSPAPSLAGQCAPLTHDAEAGGVHGQCDSIALQATVGSALAHCQPRDLLAQRRNTPWLHGAMPLLCRQEKRGEPGQGVVCLDAHTPWHSLHGKTATVALSRSLASPEHRAVFRAARIGAGPLRSRAVPRARHTGGCSALAPGVPAPWEVFPVHGHLWCHGTARRTRVTAGWREGRLAVGLVRLRP